jgi:hypothetical protein
MNAILENLEGTKKSVNKNRAIILRSLDDVIQLLESTHDTIKSIAKV